MQAENEVIKAVDFLVLRFYYTNTLAQTHTRLRVCDAVLLLLRFEGRKTSNKKHTNATTNATKCWTKKNNNMKT